MRPNLSMEKIASALAALGTSAFMVACGGADKPANTPVDATETATPASGAANPTEAQCAHKGGDGSCGAGHKAGDGSCGAGHKAADGSCGAKTGEAAPADTKPAEAASAPATAAAEAKPETKAADPKKADPKKPAAKKSGAASCGAGTCSGKK